MKITELPHEIIFEIIKFSQSELNLLFKLTLVCKELHNLFDNQEFCKQIYNSFFGWRNIVLNNNPSNIWFINKITNQKPINYRSLLQKELNFWNSWNFYSQPNEFQLLNNFDNDKHQRFLKIKRLKAEDQRNIITQPIFYNTGVYYFEIKCLQCRHNDNVFVGFIFQPTNTINNYNRINFNNFIGSNDNKGSFGLYFPNGNMYGVILATTKSLKPIKYANQSIKVNTKVGVYLDSNNLLVRFVLVKEKKLFPMLALDKFLNESEMKSFKKKKLVLYPAVSLLFEDAELELNSTVGFKSIKKAKWIKEVLSQQKY